MIADDTTAHSPPPAPYPLLRGPGGGWVTLAALVAANGAFALKPDSEIFAALVAALLAATAITAVRVRPHGGGDRMVLFLALAALVGAWAGWRVWNFADGGRLYDHAALSLASCVLGLARRARRYWYSWKTALDATLKWDEPRLLKEAERLAGRDDLPAARAVAAELYHIVAEAGLKGSWPSARQICAMRAFSELLYEGGGGVRRNFAEARWWKKKAHGFEDAERAERWGYIDPTAP